MDSMNPQEPAMPVPATDPPAAGGHHLSGVRRIVATTLLSVGLIAIGGVAIVNAASPAPAASGAPSGSGNPTHPGGGSGTPGDCPNMGGSTAPAG
jgi:hypothetical protein